MLTPDSTELKFAIKAVSRAALLVKHIQHETVSATLSKDDRSPVTVADFASQALVSQLLIAAFPNDPLVGEEDSTALRSPSEAVTLAQVTHFVAEAVGPTTPEQVCAWIDHGKGNPADRFWTIDPIDGTKGFLRAQQYAVALALLIDGQVQIGILGCPNLSDGYAQEIGGPGSLVVAVRGRGTWARPLQGNGSFTQLRVSDQRDSAQARVLRSFEAAHTNVNQLDQIIEYMGVNAEPVRLDSQAKYALLAGGRGDLLFRLISPKAPNYKERIWDQAAGSLIAQESGGRITDLDGKPLDFRQGRALGQNRGVLASNQHLHTAAVSAIKALGA